MSTLMRRVGVGLVIVIAGGVSSRRRDNRNIFQIFRKDLRPNLLFVPSIDVAFVLNRSGVVDRRFRRPARQPTVPSLRPSSYRSPNS